MGVLTDKEFRDKIKAIVICVKRKEADILRAQADYLANINQITTDLNQLKDDFNSDIIRLLKDNELLIRNLSRLIDPKFDQNQRAKGEKIKGPLKENVKC